MSENGCQFESVMEELDRFDRLPWWSFEKLLFVLVYKNIQRVNWWVLKIKSFFQTIFRGYSDKDTWDIDAAFHEWIIPRLRALRERESGFPRDIATQEEWNNILDQMITGFQFGIDDDYIFDEEEKEAVETAHKLFAEWHGALWD